MSRMFEEGVSRMFVENSPESHNPVEMQVSALRAIREMGRLGRTLPAVLKAPAAILAPRKDYSRRRGGSDDGAMADGEGYKIRTPGAVV